MKVNPKRIPLGIRRICKTIQKHDFEAWIVGGAVRDLILRRVPKDWDIATNAEPRMIQEIFDHTIPTGAKFGTISVRVAGKNFVEVTTFRKESHYLDSRRPNEVLFLDTVEEDLGRRDFTVNAMAIDPALGEVLDPFGGLKDIKRKRLRSVGKAEKRFREDALRILRAGRFASQLEFRCSEEILLGAKKEHRRLNRIAPERIREELNSLLLGRSPSAGLNFLRQTGALKIFLPELLEGWKIQQGGWHSYDVFTHTLRVIEFAPKDLVIRLGALLHDIAKPRCRVKEGKRYRFTGHEREGERMSEAILNRLRYSKHMRSAVLPLVRHHLFQESDILASGAALRRFIKRVGLENVENLMLLREADVRGCGPRKRIPKELQELRRALKAFQKESSALKVRDLAINGKDVMETLGLKPGPKVGEILDGLLEEVLENPDLNQRETLLKRLQANALR